LEKLRKREAMVVVFLLTTTTIYRNNGCELRDELGALCAAAFPASVIHNEPLIDLSPFLPSSNPSQAAAASDTSTPPDATAPSLSATPPDTPEVLTLSDTPATQPADLTPLLRQLPHALHMIQTQPLSQPNAEICWFADSSAVAGMSSLTSGFKTWMPRPTSTKIRKNA